MNGDSANGFELAQDRLTPIEVLAVERCLQLLAPGGRMGHRPSAKRPFEQASAIRTRVFAYA